MVEGLITGRFRLARGGSGVGQSTNQRMLAGKGKHGAGAEGS
jgi:hypothetical protein